MAHNLFGNRFYGHRQPAWHKLGLVTQEDMSGVDALTALGGGYYFEKRPVTVLMNGQMSETGDYALIRSAVVDDPMERNFGYVTKRYNIIQPLEICEIFDQNVNKPVETLGMLGKGERLFLTWELPTIDVKGDEVKQYGFTAIGYDAKFGYSLYVTNTRVVCQNTWNAAVSSEDNRLFAGKHNSTKVGRDLAIWMEHAQNSAQMKSLEYAGVFNKMAETPLTEKEEVYNMLFGIFPDPKPLPADYPNKLRDEKQTVIDEQAEKAEEIRNGIFGLFDGQGTAITGDVWGLWNATTEYFNWGQASKKPVEYSIMLGNRANQMNKAYAYLNTYVSKGEQNEGKSNCKTRKR